MALIIVKEAGDIWKRFSKGTGEKDFNFELEIHKKLLEFFQVGDYYYYVFNVSEGQFDFVSSGVTSLLGYELGEINVPFFLSNIHKEDQPWFLNFENKVANFFATLTPEQVPNYKVRYDYRIQKKDGNYIRILQQVVTIQYDEHKGVLRTFGVHTDISHLKTQGLPILSFIGFNGEPSYIDVQAPKVFATDAIKLTKREKQVLLLLVQGTNSSQISKRLFISEMTVQTHRKNIMRKTNSPNVAVLVSNAIYNGWI